MGHRPFKIVSSPNDKLLKIEKYGPTYGPILLRQGEPGTSQYTSRIHEYVWDPCMPN